MSKADQALIDLYELLRKRSEGSFGTLNDEDRRAYFRAAKRRSRAKNREAIENGAPAPTVVNIRAALSDAALMIVACGAPGSDQIETVLQAVFSQPGIGLTVRSRAARGTIAPILAKVK